MACNGTNNSLNSWCKDHPTIHTDEAGKEYCVFHAPIGHKSDPATSQPLSVEEFNELIYEEITRSKRANRKCDLSGTIFPGDIFFDKYNEENPLPDVSFGNAVFSGAANFGWATFSGEASFAKATFSGKAFFGRTTFSSEVSFAEATFSDAANFVRAVFSSSAYFGRTTFSVSADFEWAVFSGEANFGMATFNDAANYGMATFSGRADFRRATFNDEASFVEATFSGSAYFGRTTFSGSANYGRAVFSGSANFGRAMFNKTDFTGVTLLESALVKLNFLKIDEYITFTGVRMRKPSFQDTDLNKCNFISCQWDEKDGRNILHDETMLLEQELIHYDGQTIKGRIKRLLLADLHPFDTWKIGRVEDLYRHMKVKYKDMHDEAEVAKWHASEKEMQRKKASIIRNPFDWFLLNIYRSLCGYGENPKRAFIVLVFALLFFSGLLAWAGIKTTNEIPTRTIGISNLVEKITPGTLYDLVLCTLQNVTFERDPNFTPTTRPGYYLIIIMKLFVPIQATLLIFALRNRFRR